MRMLALKCESCGAPLDFPADTREANCLYCDNRILIERTSPPTSPKPAKPPTPAPDDRRAKVAQEIAQLDREWEAYRAMYLKRDFDGQYDIPEVEHCRMGMWTTVVIAVIAILMAIIEGSAAVPVTFVAMILMVGTLIGLKRQMNIARVYSRSKRNYERERLRLLNAIPSS